MTSTAMSSTTRTRLAAGAVLGLGLVAGLAALVVTIVGAVLLRRARGARRA